MSNLPTIFLFSKNKISFFTSVDKIYFKNSFEKEFLLTAVMCN